MKSGASGKKKGSSSVPRRSPSLIDTHCHLEMEQFDHDRDDMLQRAFSAGIEAMITVGSDFETTRKGIELAAGHPGVYASVGIHPHDAKDVTESVMAQMKEWASLPQVVAIGETGLDYHYDHSPRTVQRSVFEQHLALAAETGLPVIVHSREARDDTLDILRSSGISRGMLHCFSGDLDMAEQAMSMGLHISIAGPVTFKKAEALRDIAQAIPDDYLLIETDAPYLAPEPYRGRRNEPAYLVHTAERIAALRGISLTDIARITTLNAKRLFGIGELPEEPEIAYQIRDSLYLNITNRCTNRCSFCVKFHSDFVKGHRLRLIREPSEDSIRAAIGDPSGYREVVFCGYGEPLQRLETVINISKWIKQNGGRVRINTNGHANLIHGRDILPELGGLVDSISVSLDAHDEETYRRVCSPAFPNAFPEMLRFIRSAATVIPDVQVTVVDLPEVDLDRCRLIAEELGVRLRIRKRDVVG